MAAILKTAILLMSFGFACVAGLDFSKTGYDPKDLESEGTLKALYDSWATKHGRLHESPGAKETRYSIFKDNLEYIHEHNKKARDYVLGLNQFADLTHDEFKSQYAGTKLNRRREERRPFTYADVTLVPDSIDWRSLGAVSEVKNQGSCGGCWAFSTTGAIEGINQIVTGELVSLSEQELIDCDTESEQGCNGGIMDDAFDYVADNGGLHNESAYPYQEVQGTCMRDSLDGPVVTIHSAADVTRKNELNLQKAVANQPVSVAIEAGGKPFQFYSGGVFTGDCGTELDHGVLAVGYGTDAGTDYWIVKNSWGPEWGESGFIRLERNIDAKEGKCGITLGASYPVKTGPNPSPRPPSPPAPRPDDSGVCCHDQQHCCPYDKPICDLDTNRCLASTRDRFGVAMLEQTPATWRSVKPYQKQFSTDSTLDEKESRSYA
ncbi:hypothetical protein R1sor_001890 [Riccia sorocarpa]|uniref:Cysteine protease n=1 Tax=Riccia sorocarpa TaxID=122646 RepID=A0ABD3GX82_9MARC